MTIELDYPWTPNDGMDFMHATAGGAYTDLLVVDRHWKRRVLAAAQRKDSEWVFYRPELDSFLTAFDELELA